MLVQCRLEHLDAFFDLPGISCEVTWGPKYAQYMYMDPMALQPKRFSAPPGLSAAKAVVPPKCPTKL